MDQATRAPIHQAASAPVSLELSPTEPGYCKHLHGLTGVRLDYQCASAGPATAPYHTMLQPFFHTGTFAWFAVMLWSLNRITVIPKPYYLRKIHVLVFFVLDSLTATHIAARKQRRHWTLQRMFSEMPLVLGLRITMRDPYVSSNPEVDRICGISGIYWIFQ